MRTIIELDENDIREAIAAKFGCDKGCVDVKAERITRGYGLSEVDGYVVCARIEKDRSVSNLPSLNGDLVKNNRLEPLWSNCHTDVSDLDLCDITGKVGTVRG